MTPRAFGGLDWLVVAVYGATLLAIGFFQARRQKTAEHFFGGGHGTSPFLAGISLFAASTSIISYIGNPGEYVQFGPLVAFLVPLVALPFYQVSVGHLLIPSFMRLPITSAYELLEVRLGRTVRQLGSIGYIVPRLIWLALILYMTSTVLVVVMGCDPRWQFAISLAIAAVTTTYTLFGGLRTVMLTQLLQSALLFAGALLTIGSITVRLGGVAAWWPRHWEEHWSPNVFFSLNPHVRVSVVGVFLYYLLGSFCATGADQVAIQRFLATRDAAAARRAFLLSNIAIAAVTLVLGLVGAALLGFFHTHPEAIPAQVTLAGNGDAFFPIYIGHYLPAGLSGLLAACLLSSAMSVLSSSINATVTVISKDFVETSAAGADRTELAKVRLARLLTLGVGAVTFLASIGMGLVRGDFIEVATKTSNLLVSPLFGLFFFGLFVKFSTPFGAIMGAIYGTAAAVAVAYWDVFTGGAALSFLWIVPVSLVATLAAGYAFSLWPRRPATGARLVWHSVIALLPLFAFVAWAGGAR